MDKEEKVICRTPNADGTTRIPRWKFDVMRSAILAAIDAAGPEGLPFSQLKTEVNDRLSETERNDLGSVPWHMTTVKLELESAGEIVRVSGATPQRLIRKSGT